MIEWLDHADRIVCVLWQGAGSQGGSTRSVIRLGLVMTAVRKCAFTTSTAAGDCGEGHSQIYFLIRLFNTNCNLRVNISLVL